MEQSIITWNVPNFVTIVLMVLLGAALFSLVVKVAGGSLGGSQ